MAINYTESSVNNSSERLYLAKAKRGNILLWLFFSQEDHETAALQQQDYEWAV